MRTKKKILVMGLFLAIVGYAEGQIVDFQYDYRNANNSGRCVYPSQSVTIDFTNTSPTLAGVTSFDWNYGDGSIHGTGQDGFHTYTVVGSYVVTLTMTFSSGITRTISHTVQVYAPPSVTFTANKDTVCPDEVINFTSSLVPPTSSVGLTYGWNFGDGGFSNLPNPPYAYEHASNQDLYSYTVRLTVTDANQCENAYELPDMITLRRRPVVDFSVPDPAGLKQGIFVDCNDNPDVNPSVVQFTNLTDAQPLRGTHTYTWDFHADGSHLSNQQDPSFAYPEGLWDVTLTAVSIQGCSASITKYAVISIVDFKATYIMLNQAGTSSDNKAVSFCTAPAVLNITGADPFADYFFDMGNGYEWYGTQPSIRASTYEISNMAYMIRAKATHRLAGCVVWDTIMVYVYDKVPALNVITDTNMCDTNSSVIFRDATVYPNIMTQFGPLYQDFGLGNVKWNFGHGSPSTATGDSVTHHYNAYATYRSEQLVTTPYGCLLDPVETFIHVFKLSAIGKFEVPAPPAPPAGCVPLSVVMGIDSLKTSSPITNFIWRWDTWQVKDTLGIDTLDVGSNPNAEHEYTDTGKFVISLILVNEQGCRDTVVAGEARVGAKPVNNWTYKYEDKCAKEFSIQVEAYDEIEWEYNKVCYTNGGMFTLTIGRHQWEWAAEYYGDKIHDISLDPGGGINLVIYDTAWVYGNQKIGWHYKETTPYKYDTLKILYDTLSRNPLKIDTLCFLYPSKFIGAAANTWQWWDANNPMAPIATVVSPRTSIAPTAHKPYGCQDAFLIPMHHGCAGEKVQIDCIGYLCPPVATIDNPKDNMDGTKPVFCTYPTISAQTSSPENGGMRYRWYMGDTINGLSISPNFTTTNGLASAGGTLYEAFTLFHPITGEPIVLDSTMHDTIYHPVSTKIDSAFIGGVWKYDTTKIRLLSPGILNPVHDYAPADSLRKDTSFYVFKNGGVVLITLLVENWDSTSNEFVCPIEIDGCRGLQNSVWVSISSLAAARAKWDGKTSKWVDSAMVLTGGTSTGWIDVETGEELMENQDTSWIVTIYDDIKCDTTIVRDTSQYEGFDSITGQWRPIKWDKTLNKWVTRDTVWYKVANFAKCRYDDSSRVVFKTYDSVRCNCGVQHPTYNRCKYCKDSATQVILISDAIMNFIASADVCQGDTIRFIDSTFANVGLVSWGIRPLGLELGLDLVNMPSHLCDGVAMKFRADTVIIDGDTLLPNAVRKPVDTLDVDALDPTDKDGTLEAVLCMWQNRGTHLPIIRPPKPTEGWTVRFNYPNTYKIELVDMCLFQCFRYDTVSVNVWPRSTPQFVTSKSAAGPFNSKVDTLCLNSGDTLFLKDASTTVVPFDTLKIVDWKWDWDGSPNVLTGAKDTFAIPQYSGPTGLNLTVTNEKGCDSMVRVLERVLVNEVMAKWRIQDNSGNDIRMFCNGVSVNFTNKSEVFPSINNSGKTSMTAKWDFGDGNIAMQYFKSGEDPVMSHVYILTEPIKKFPVTIEAWVDGTDCKHVWVDTITIVNPIANFTDNGHVFPCPGPVGKEVAFMDSSQAAQYIKLYYWDFGDTNCAEELRTALGAGMVNVVHQYMRPGVYTVSLTVWDTLLGCSDNKTKIGHVVIDGPLGKLKYDPKSGCVPLDVKFQANIEKDYNNNRTADSIWLVPDGDTIIRKIRNAMDIDIPFTYKTPGAYLPMMYMYKTVKNAEGKEEMCMVIDHREDSVYVIDLHPNFVTDSLVCLDVETDMINITSVIPAHLISDAVHWEYGNGKDLWIYDLDIFSKDGKSKYDEPGSYQITLTETYKLCTKDITLDINVMPWPEFRLIPSDTVACDGLPVTFSITEDTLDDLAASRVKAYEWTFGAYADTAFKDTTVAMTSIKNNLPGSLEFNATNLYHYLLKVTFTPKNCVKIWEDSTYIYANKSPKAEFSTTPNPPEVETGGSIEFTDKSTRGDADIVSWEWDFGYPGNEGDDVQNPTHKFDKTSGVWEVTLKITDENKCVGTVTHPVTITEKINFPNIFTPNGTAGPMFFRPLDDKGYFMKFKLDIYNKWGMLVWSQRCEDDGVCSDCCPNYNDPAFWWDGRNKQGAMVSDGVYYWVVYAERMTGGKNIIQNGSVTVTGTKK